MLKMQLSKHFDLSEFLKTSHAELMPRQEEGVKNFIPSLKTLCLYILEPLRNYIGKPMIITSGFRSKELNSAVGGSITSQHCAGQAADFQIAGMTPEEILKLFLDRKITIHFGPLIKEIIGAKAWTHISLGYPFRLNKPVCQILTTDDGVTYNEINF